MTRDGIFRYAWLEPLLPDLEARWIDGHPRLEVINAAEHEVDRSAGKTTRLDASNEVIEVFDCGDVVIVSLKLYIGVNGL